MLIIASAPHWVNFFPGFIININMMKPGKKLTRVKKLLFKQFHQIVFSPKKHLNYSRFLFLLKFNVLSQIYSQTVITKIT